MFLSVDNSVFVSCSCHTFSWNRVTSLSPVERMRWFRTSCWIGCIQESYDVAHSIGVQNVVLPFLCLQEPIFNVLVIFFVLILGVYVRLVKSLLILSFYLSKQLKESSITRNLGVKRL